jgi:predicted DNA-binding transcriptional regulator AlpA
VSALSTTRTFLVTDLSGVLQRLAALELAVAGIGHNNPPEPIDDDRPDNEPGEFDPAMDRRLPTKATAQRYGVSTRTIGRWRDDPKLNFPKPDNVNGRNYSWLSELVRWDHQRAAAKPKKDPL